MASKYVTVFHAWVSRGHVCERVQNPVFTGNLVWFVLAGISRVESREKARNCSYSDVLNNYDNLQKNRLCVCVYDRKYVIDFYIQGDQKTRNGTGVAKGGGGWWRLLIGELKIWRKEYGIGLCPYAPTLPIIMAFNVQRILFDTQIFKN